MFSNCTTENCNFTKNWALSRVICRLLIIILLDISVCVSVCVCVCVCVRVCACVCVCLYSFTCWLIPTARCLWHIGDVRNNDLLLWVLLGASAKFLHLRFRKCHVSPPKTKTPDRSKLERKRFDIMCSAKRWYILI